MKPSTFKIQHKFQAFFLFASLCVAGLFSTAYAAGELLVAPTRVVFEGNMRSASVNLTNTGGEAATYRIEFQRKRMLEGGGMEAVEKPLAGELFSDRLIRFAPRQVTLQPGQSQTVRLMLRRKPNMQAGEYRSHLRFQAIPKEDASGGIEAFDKKNQQGISINLIPVFGVSIPVIVRHGKVASELKLEELKLLKPELSKDKDNREPMQLALRMDRKGNASVYGDMTVYFQSGGKQFVVGRMNGVAVYSPNTHRRVKIKLNQAPDLDIRGGKLHAVFREKANQGGKLLAETTIDIP